MGSPEIGPDAVMKIDGFAHVEYGPGGIPHEINAGTMGQTLQLLLNETADQLHSSDGIQLYSSIADIGSKDSTGRLSKNRPDILPARFIGRLFVRLPAWQDINLSC